MEKQAKTTASLHEATVRDIMSTPSGRHWLWDHLSACHVFHSSFTGDALTTAYAEGERNMGLRLLSQIMQACPDNYILAQREANEREHTDDRRSSATGSNGPADQQGSDRAEGDPDSSDYDDRDYRHG